MARESGMVVETLTGAGLAPEAFGSADRKIGIFLVDDNKSFLGVASNFLSAHRNVRIDGCLTSPVQALREIGRIKPDLVVIDLVMPEMNGLEATRMIKSNNANTRVVIVSLHDQGEYRASAKAVGADEFLPKTEFADQIMSVIDRLFSGQIN